MAAVDIKNLTVGAKKRVPYVTLKAFTTNPSTGNPAAVVFLPPASSSFNDLTDKEIKRLYPSDEALLAQAREFNFPMTAYLVPLDAKQGKYALRWFYPAGEAELCGHATLGLSWHLFSSKVDVPSSLDLETVHYGTVRSQFINDPFDSTSKVVAMDFPELLDFEEKKQGGERWKEVLERLGSAISNIKDEDVVRIDETPARIMVQLKESVDVKGLDIDPKKLNPKSERKVFVKDQCLILFQIASASTGASAPHVISRYIHTDPDFATEDIATGSAHCAVIPQVLTEPGCLEALSKNHPSSDFGGTGALSRTIRVRQVSNPGGEMTVEWRKSEHKVRIMGRAVEVSKGEVEI